MNLLNLNVSPKALEIASKKPRFWEHHLYVQILSDELNEARFAFQDEILTRDRLTSKYLESLGDDSNDSLSEIIILTKNRASFIQALANTFEKYLPDNNEEAFGPSSVPIHRT